jgi:hypothetical protein
MRRREDKAVAAAIEALEEDQPDHLSAAKRLILGGIARKLRDLLKLDAYLDPLVSIVNRRTRALIPAAVERHRLLESIRRDLEALGLERRTRELPALADYLKTAGPAPLKREGAGLVEPQGSSPRRAPLPPHDGEP